ncbi:MAG: Tad domain-containing protein [Candidatus Eremiobacteraeota bacterium]|nr:Tad domain-containing protein [Candidatus Eremiobacteraeota bacterium]MBV8499295.1 Tad domain-containing protein [Candidatus Eremiobacteraeota bacterium]
MRRKGESGQVLPLIAICLAALMGFGGMAVDVAYWRYQLHEQQNATDAAAVGGAQQLLYSGCPNSAAATGAADGDAASGGYPNGGNVKITVTNPPIATFTADSCAVSVQIHKSAVATWFTKLFGKSGGVGETTNAVATLSGDGGGTGCIYLLSTTMQSNFNGSSITAPKCGILINDTANFNGAHVDAPSITYAGGKPNENGATFTAATPAPMMPVADPCPEISGCAYLAANPPSSSSCGSFNGNGFSGSLNAGCYDSLNLNGANVTLNPGTYVLNGNSNFNGAHVTGAGVTIYVTASGTPPNFNGATMSLTPPTTGSETGVLYYQVPTNTASPNFNGSNDSYSGLMYAPGATSVNFNGAKGGYLVLVFGGTNFNGTNAYDFGAAPSGQSLIRKAVLAE